MKRFTLCALLLASITTAQSKPPRTYPEHGTVGSIRARTLSPVTVLGTGHTVTASASPETYRIETDTQFYGSSEPGKTSTMIVGQMIEFRIENGYAYVRNAKGKENRYHIVGQDLKPAKQ